MKDVVKKAAAFILFESPVDFQVIRLNFIGRQNFYKAQLPNWPFSATRKKLIVEFWFRRVSLHFFILLILASAVLLLLRRVSENFPAPLFFFALPTFFILILIHYGPIFYGDYLPNLATVIAEQETLAAAEDDLKKCKRSQYSIPTLTIIFYVLSKMADIPMVPVNDHSAELLNHLYGCDKDKLKQNLGRLYKFSVLSPKEKAEIHKGISAARSFFQDLQHPPAAKLLDEMEIKLQNV
ncbi:MAG: hypothetical protein ABIR15_14485 [Chitinophagaceae bacterium]